MYRFVYDIHIPPPMAHRIDGRAIADAVCAEIGELSLCKDMYICMYIYIK